MEKAKNTNKRALWIGIAVVAVLLACLALLYIRFSEKPVEGAKTLVMEVVHGDESTKDFTYHTDAEYLGELLLAEGLIAGSESEYGLFVETVDGETADSEKQEWWCLTKDGEMCMTGVDSTPIADGEHYELTLTTGW